MLPTAADFQEATEKAANKATREATRTVKNAMWGRWRENAAAAIKARLARKKPPVYVPEPEAAPEPERRFEDEFGEDMRDVVRGVGGSPRARPPSPLPRLRNGMNAEIPR